MQEYVAGLMFSADGKKVALVRKDHPDWQAGKLNAIGGKIEPGEYVGKAMRREFLEEAGIDYDHWIPFVRLYRSCVYVVFFYIAFTDDVFNVRTAEREAIDVYDIDEEADELEQSLIANMRWLIPMALDPNIRSGEFTSVRDVAGN